MSIQTRPPCITQEEYDRLYFGNEQDMVTLCHMLVDALNAADARNKLDKRKHHRAEKVEETKK